MTFPCGWLQWIATVERDDVRCVRLADAAPGGFFPRVIVLQKRHVGKRTQEHPPLISTKRVMSAQSSGIMPAHGLTLRTPSRASAWIAPLLFLCVAYALLGLTFTEQLSHDDLMQRCVLMDPNLARIWSVANIEIGLSYFGVLVGRVYYFLRLYRQSRQHLIDLGLAPAYLLVSFALDYTCVLHFQPFIAMLIGDAIVMTFTLAVSRQLWFQRLLGVFVPIIFVTCAFGHFMEGGLNPIFHTSSESQLLLAPV